MSTFTLTHDGESRAATVSNESATYAYDGEAGGVTTTYVYDAMGNLAAEYSAGTNPSAPAAGCEMCDLFTDHFED